MTSFRLIQHAFDIFKPSSKIEIKICKRINSFTLTYFFTGKLYFYNIVVYICKFRCFFLQCRQFNYIATLLNVNYEWHVFIIM